jgi:ribosome maturation factor RimP
VPGTEVLAVEITGKERFRVYVDHPAGVDHALCQRVTEALRSYLDVYSIEVSSPGAERPLRTPAHFRQAVGRTVRLKTPEDKLSGQVVSVDDRVVQIQKGSEPVAIPYEQIVRANLIDEGWGNT